MKALGIDIGTTSICMICCESETGEILWSAQEKNRFAGETFSQDPEEILEKVFRLIRGLDESGCGLEEIAGIGVSSQMHGILYVDRQGNAVSPFYTWKDQKGNEHFREGKTYAEYLNGQGIPAYTGYGITTHFYLGDRGMIPEAAAAFVGIGDYLVMRLTGKKDAAVNRTMAHSFGGYDLETDGFEKEKLERAGVDVRYLPHVTQERIAGKYRGIPVAFACGDNQASFFGAVSDVKTQISVNVGTGSQVSVWIPKDARLLRLCRQQEQAEVRPFIEEGYLCVGASVNGGKTYERLAAFLEEVVFSFTGQKISAYEEMARIVRGMDTTSLRVEPLLYGARQSRERHGGTISCLMEENFHPEDLIFAYVRGMAEELHALYLNFPEEIREGRTEIVASGNGIRRNEKLREQIQELFRMGLLLQKQEEEAAYGAARFICDALGQTAEQESTAASML